MVHLTDYQYVEIILILIVAGLFAGFFGSFFGVGGGTVLVPTLLAVYTHINLNFAIDMHQTIAASLALVVFNTVMATRKHHKDGNLPVQYFKMWAVWLFIGTILGALVMAYASSFFLKVLFTVYLFLAFLSQVFYRQHKNKSEAERMPHGVVKAAGGVLVGGFSLLLGLAGGAFSTPFFTFFGYPIKKAMAISMAGGIIIGAVGTVAAIVNGWGVPGRFVWSIGYVNLITVVIVAPFVMVSSPWGVKVSSRIPSKVLRWLYALFLLLIAIYMVFQLSLHR